MCGRVFTTSSPERLIEAFGVRPNASDREVLRELLPRHNGAPGQWFPVIVRDEEYADQAKFELMRWGLIPYWEKDPKSGRRPIMARAETVARLPSFRYAYARQRCLIPVDGFFEWRSTFPPRRPYAVAMKDRTPFAIAGIWERWRHPETGETIRTFCVITTVANELMRLIHERMPVIIAPQDYTRWLGQEPDPRDLLRPFPAALMDMWPISMRVNNPENDDEGILDPVEE